MKLKVDYCTYKAAKYAVLNWHYSHSIPAGKMVRVGVWEDDKYVGCVLFSRGANKHIGRPYGLTQYECCELTRVALSKHKTPVTKIIKIAIILLKKVAPDVKMIVSYADANQGHKGGIYQAGNWYYQGEFASEIGVKLNGKVTHRRSINSKYGTSDLKWLREHIDKNAEVLDGLSKFKYLMPLTPEMKLLCEKIKKPYPCAVSLTKTASFQEADGGVNPTTALQNSEVSNE